MPRRAALTRIVLLAAGAGVAAGVIWLGHTAGARPALVLETSVVDFGPLRERATRFVELRNAGRRPLHILAVSSSCGCTTAEADAAVLAPGTTARLAITFDPAAHGPRTGPARHAVYLRTNDVRAPEVEVEIRAVVLEATVR
ncbi:MAG: DUF1573 domain-containing protein [Armatimonadota bacterium]|nr:DUF1573 domain-containing protein [Armatimonadota bacterium]MDR7520077.1 DUF1573 domain-containing protein [Armatimonadota bacterium]MDR7549932.1 DUF1573 domain-containing protein [Armatimonadota bacterium]